MIVKNAQPSQIEETLNSFSYSVVDETTKTTLTKLHGSQNRPSDPDAGAYYCIEPINASSPNKTYTKRPQTDPNSISADDDIGHLSVIESLIHLSTSAIQPQPTGGLLRPLELNAVGKQQNVATISSEASSTHFTLVNGMGKVQHYNADKAPGCCSCKPLAALVIIMTALMALIVLLLVFYAECEYLYSAIFVLYALFVDCWQRENS